MNKRKGTGRQRGRRKNSRLGRYKRSILMICSVLAVLSGVLAVNSLRLQARNTEYKEQEEELRSQIDKEKKRAEEIEEFKEYVKTEKCLRQLLQRIGIFFNLLHIWTAVERLSVTHIPVNLPSKAKDSRRISPGVFIGNIHFFSRGHPRPSCLFILLP